MCLHAGGVNAGHGIGRPIWGIMTLAQRTGDGSGRTLLAIQAAAPNASSIALGACPQPLDTRTEGHNAAVMSEDLKIGLFIGVAALGFLQVIRWVRRTSKK